MKKSSCRFYKNKGYYKNEGYCDNKNNNDIRNPPSLNKHRLKQKRCSERFCPLEIEA